MERASSSLAAERPALARLTSTASALALAACMVAAGAPAHAQDQAAKPAADKSGSTQLSEVVVTAEFREQNLQKTPIAITALNAEMLRQRSITNIIDVAQAAPNVTMTLGSGGYGKSNQATIRGIGQNDFSFAFEPRVGFYIDDVYYATVFGSVFDLLDTDRVEIERGPQGTLNGRNSVGGAIRLFTKKPTGNNSGYLEGTYGSFNHESVKGAFDFALVPDKLMVRLAAGMNRQDGWVKRYNFACLDPADAGSLPGLGLPGSRNGCQNGTLGGTNLWDVRGQVRWMISDRIEDNISADYSDDRSEAPADTLLSISVSQDPSLPGAFGVPAGAPNSLALWLNSVGGPVYGLATVPYTTNGSGATVVGPAPANLTSLLGALQSGPYSNYAIFGNPGRARPEEGIVTPAINTVRSGGVSNVLDIDVTPGVHLKSITAFREYTGEFGTSQSQLALPVQEVYNEVSHHQLSQELRLTGTTFGNRLDWALGGFYLSTFNENSGRIDDEGFGIYIPGLGEIPYLFDQYVDDKSGLQNESAFAHGVVHVTDQLSLEAGLRFSHETKNYSYVREYFTGAPSVFITAPDTSISKWNPRFAVDYQVTPDVLFYASYSTGFTAGGFDPRPFSAADAALPVAPENVIAYEAGFKAELLDHRLRLNAAAFLTHWNNIQLTLAGCPVGCPTTSPFYYGNGGDAHIKGFEVEAEAHPIDHWLITAALGYSDFRYVRLNASVNTTGDPTALTLDSPAVNAPRLKVSVGTQYDVDLGGLGTLTPRIDYVVQSRTYFGADRNDPYSYQPGYGLMNARLTWRPTGGDWSVSGYVTNLTDKLYYTSKANELNSFGTATGTVGEPREFGVTVRRNF